MTVRAIGSLNNRFIGLSTDAKPTPVDAGAEFIEYDTPDILVFNGSGWVSRVPNTPIVGFKDASGAEYKQDSITGAFVTVDYEHHELHSGSHYSVRGVQDLSINNVLDFTLLAPNTTKWIHLNWNIEVESETSWFVYESAVATNALANAITPINNNRNSILTSGVALKYELQATLAAANLDTDVTTATLIESGIAGSGKSFGDSERAHEIVLKQNTLYCMRAIATAAGYINFYLNWYEHTNR